jgi:starch phosphorylase
MSVGNSPIPAGAPSVAYFCMEYGMQNSFKLYSGGLGILAGDMLKAAHDVKAPLVGIGIKWARGYAEQSIDPDGKPIDCYPEYDYPFLEDTGVTVSVKIKGADIACKVWKTTRFGNVPLYLLDTKVPGNSEQLYTAFLYGGGGEDRVAQEIILGAGGVKALRALGIKVDTYHFNEGHAVFAGLQLLREEIDAGVPFKQAIENVKKNIVFTTHTPIPAGNERHSLECLLYMGGNFGFTTDQLNWIGNTPFNMTVAALRLSRKSNAVAELHGVTAREMWKGEARCSEIVTVTNGVHRETWVGEAFLSKPTDPEVVWKAHTEQKAALIDLVRTRTGVQLDPSILLIGFSRRATGYKRGNLLFSDLDRARKLLDSGKLQVVFSGKSHPRDVQGRQVIAELIKMTALFPKSVVFIPDYDMDIGQAMTRGADVWLNNPRRPLEACGTSGMKAAMNGVLNVSILDGWWPEACKHGENGWAIGGEHVPPSVEEQDRQDAGNLYSVFEQEVIPTYYQDQARWKKMMVNSITSCSDAFCATRMVREYYEKMYR